MSRARKSPRSTGSSQPLGASSDGSLRAPEPDGGSPPPIPAAAASAPPVADLASAEGHARDPSDLARDQRLRSELAIESGRSPSDRHRERLTAIEAEEDDVHGEEDEEETASDLRRQAVEEEDAADEDRDQL